MIKNFKKTKMLQVALSAQLEEELSVEMKRTGLARAEIARHALDEYFRKLKRETATWPQEYEKR